MYLHGFSRVPILILICNHKFYLYEYGPVILIISLYTVQKPETWIYLPRFAFVFTRGFTFIGFKNLNLPPFIRFNSWIYLPLHLYCFSVIKGQFVSYLSWFLKWFLQPHLSPYPFLIQTHPWRRKLPSPFFKYRPIPWPWTLVLSRLRPAKIHHWKQ